VGAPCLSTSLADRETPEALQDWGSRRGGSIAPPTSFARAGVPTLYAGRRDRLSAARVTVWLAWDSAAFRGEMAVATGWLQRAERWLAGQCRARAAWLAVQRYLRAARRWRSGGGGEAGDARDSSQ
jgi:hypothetical protein